MNRLNSAVRKILQFLIIVIVTILAVTNPGSHEYEIYASKQLNIYLKEDLCNQITEQRKIKLRTPCSILVDTATPYIKASLNQNTQQQNFLLFSIYKTDLAISPITSEYHFTTLGIFDRFFTYNTEINNEY